MKRVCSFCQKLLDGSHEHSTDEAPITHGICPQCIDSYFAGSGLSMKGFLDKLEGEVVLLDSELRPVEANTAARQNLPDTGAIRLGGYPGELFGCIYADTTDGCGGDVHCQSCTIRKAVEHTRATGQALTGVQTLAELAHLTGDTRVRFVVSTERVDQRVLLRIDEMLEMEGTSSGAGE